MPVPAPVLSVNQKNEYIRYRDACARISWLLLSRYSVLKGTANTTQRIRDVHQGLIEGRRHRELIRLNFLAARDGLLLMSVDISKVSGAKQLAERLRKVPATWEATESWSVDDKSVIQATRASVDGFLDTHVGGRFRFPM